MFLEMGNDGWGTNWFGCGHVGLKRCWHSDEILILVTILNTLPLKMGAVGENRQKNISHPAVKRNRVSPKNIISVEKFVLFDFWNVINNIRLNDNWNECLFFYGDTEVSSMGKGGTIMKYQQGWKLREGHVNTWKCPRNSSFSQRNEQHIQ